MKNQWQRHYIEQGMDACMHACTLTGISYQSRERWESKGVKQTGVVGLNVCCHQKVPFRLFALVITVSVFRDDVLQLGGAFRLVVTIDTFFEIVTENW